ncbi:hypothetical protein [Plasticicumulans sp.]|uniref:hypothetical protein n=1 Tax=Plasticicumulans sp. TaxID=2307179 RepID=UPI00321F6ED3
MPPLRAALGNQRIMQIGTGFYAGKKARVARALFGSDTIKVAGDTIKLPEDIAQLVVTSRAEYRSFWTMAFIILISLTIVGLVIGIPWFILAKKTQVGVAIRLNNGRQFGGLCDKQEWDVLAKYATLPMLG